MAQFNNNVILCWGIVNLTYRSDRGSGTYPGRYIYYDVITLPISYTEACFVLANMEGYQYPYTGNCATGSGSTAIGIGCIKDVMNGVRCYYITIGY